MAEESESNKARDLRRLYDRLLHAGWLENVIDNPDDPNKTLQWFVDPNNSANNGMARFNAFNLLYAELCRIGPITGDELLMIKVLQQELSKGGDSENH